MKKSSIGAAALVLSGLLAASAAWADTSFVKLDAAAGSEASNWAAVFDFDGDGCLPSPAISRAGVQNPGLNKTGDVTGNCRGDDQLSNSNTYYRQQCVQEGADRYCVNMYALYFMKDQVSNGLSAGHKHDFEFALVWLKNGALTDASYSHHGKVTTKGKSELPFNDALEHHVKFVYHKDDAHGGTHAMRFAKPDEYAENPSKQWVTPTLVDWYQMQGAGANAVTITNLQMRQKLNKFDYGKANCSVNDGNFKSEITKAVPNAYPKKDVWEKAVDASIKEHSK